MAGLNSSVELKNPNMETAGTYEQLYVSTKFKELCKKLADTHGHNNFRKNGKSSGLGVFAMDNYIELNDYTQKGNKLHKMVLSYDEVNHSFNLKEILGVEEHTYNNISLEHVQNFLGQIEKKLRERINGKNIDKTSKAISSAIDKMFRESDRGLFRRK